MLGRTIGFFWVAMSVACLSPSAVFAGTDEIEVTYGAGQPGTPRQVHRQKGVEVSYGPVRLQKRIQVDTGPDTRTRSDRARERRDDAAILEAYAQPLGLRVTSDFILVLEILDDRERSGARFGSRAVSPTSVLTGRGGVRSPNRPGARARGISLRGAGRPAQMRRH